MFSQETKRILIGWTGAVLVSAFLGGTVLGTTAVVERHNTQLAILNNDYNNAQPMPYNESQEQVPQVSTHGPGWLVVGNDQAIHIKYVQITEDPSGTGVDMGVILANGQAETLYNTGQWAWSVNKPQ